MVLRTLTKREIQTVVSIERNSLEADPAGLSQQEVEDYLFWIEQEVTLWTLEQYQEYLRGRQVYPIEGKD